MAMIKCRECGAEISASAKTCPKCGAPTKKKSKILRFLKWIVGLFILLVVIAAIFGKKEGGSRQTAAVTSPPQSASPSPAAAADAPPATASAPPPAVPVPASQVAFLKAVEDATAAYKAADTDFQKGATRPARAKAICAALKTTSARDWVGTVSELSTNNDGKGVLSVTLSDGVVIGTWNNALSDIGSDTLIEASSPVFAAMGTLKDNQAVTFSGNFIKSDVDCVSEKSLSLSGSMRSPAFAFRFSAIKPQ